MSILIMGMEMPKNCNECKFGTWSNLHQTECCKRHDFDPCFEDHSREYMEKRADFCPLIEVPEPHGRLVDADEITRWSLHRTGKRLLAVDTAPTVIEREDGETDADAQ